MARVFLFLGAANAFLAVAAGAFGAHALKARLPPDLLGVWDLGARYHLVHALGLLAVGLWLGARPPPAVEAGGWLLQGGILLFSGSLYALALSGVGRLGAITPIGGVAFLAGWAALAWSALKS